MSRVHVKMHGDAKFSACGLYRWWLTRVWDAHAPLCALIGMNPSTANATENDATVRKEIHFVRSWGFGGLLKLNAYGYKATLPDDLYAARARGVDIVGACNTAAHLVEYLREFDVQKTVACWGRLQQETFYGNRGWDLRDQLGRKYGVQLDCFRKNSDASPAHPLYLPYGLLPEPWNYAAVASPESRVASGQTILTTESQSRGENRR
jgi:hypothetical protein